MPLRPFERLSYAEVPERPRVPHPFFDAPEQRVRVTTPHFGELALSVRRWGAGPPLLCVHGLMTSSYSFRYVLEPLGRDFEVIVFDLPGAGRSDTPDVTYSATALADLVGALMERLGIVGAPVLGNSMGGYLAMWLALRRPEVLSRIVNLHSPGLATPRMWALQAALAMPGTGRLLDHLVARDPMRWAFRNVHYYDETLKSREEAREYAAPLTTAAGRRAFRRYLGDTLRASTMRTFANELRRRGGALGVPLGLVYATRDPVVPPSIGERLAALVPDARLVWLEHASHFAHVDAPAAFVAAALPMLRGSA